ncbi:MAG: class I SAM-dependent DNA methyltransferase [Endozoicomonas sp.]
MTAPMYTRFASEYEAAIVDNVYNAHLERPSLLSMLPELEGKSVLDLGCGPGVYAEYLMLQGATVTATDISTEMVEIVKNRFGGRVRSYAHDMGEGLPKEGDNSYDLVICPLAIHYLEDLSLLFADVRRVLKDDGAFVFSTHHPMNDFQCSQSGNYFERELIIEEWDTIGQPVEVQFYRRSLTDLFRAVSAADLYVADLYEGKPAEAMKEVSPENYEYLSRNPNFIFFKCQPIA